MYLDRLPVGEVEAYLKQFESVTIVTHLNPDADTIGTGLGLYNLLKRARTHRVEIVNLSAELPTYLDFLPGFQRIKRRMEFEESLIIACDCGSLKRLGISIEGRAVLNIDHHRSNERYGDINVVVPEAASASMVAYRLFEQIFPIDAQTATCFYTALLSDTRYFTTASVNTTVFGVAEALVGLGADPAMVSYHFTQRRSLASLRILHRALGHLRLHLDAQVATMWVDRADIQATGARMPDMEGIVDYGRSLATVEIGIFVIEDSNGVRVSLRSKMVDVAALAAHFGGGGHTLAAGFVLEVGSVTQTIEDLLAQIKRLGLLDETQKR